MMFCLCEILFKLQLHRLTPQVEFQLSSACNGEFIFLTSIDSALPLLLLPLWQVVSHLVENQQFQPWLQPHSGSNQLCLEPPCQTPLRCPLYPQRLSTMRWVIRNLLHNTRNQIYRLDSAFSWCDGRARPNVRGGGCLQNHYNSFS